MIKSFENILQESRKSFDDELRYFNKYFDVNISALEVGKVANQIFSNDDDSNDFGENQRKAYKLLNADRLNFPGNFDFHPEYIKGYSILVTKWFEETGGRTV